MDQIVKPQGPEQEGVANQPEQNLKSPENVPPQTPETQRAPEATQEATGEMTPSGVGPAVQPVNVPVDDQANVPASDDAQATTDITEPAKATDLDKTFVKAAEEVIDKYEGKPYEEEEEHSKLQIKYLWQRFKRKIGKD
jgi:hypothetical protein